MHTPWNERTQQIRPLPWWRGRLRGAVAMAGAAALLGVGIAIGASMQASPPASSASAEAHESAEALTAAVPAVEPTPPLVKVDGNCQAATVTGFISPSPIALAGLLMDEDPADLAAFNPLICTTTRKSGASWGYCKGVTFVESHSVIQVPMTDAQLTKLRTVVEQDTGNAIDFIVVDTLLDFTTGRQKMRMYARREDANCVDGLTPRKAS